MEYLTTEEAAELLRLAPQTLNKWRVYGDGPTYHKAGGRVLYRRADLVTWLESRRFEHSGQTAQAAG